MSNVITQRYTGGDYLAANADWHVADSPWKARQVLDMLAGYDPPATVAEAGCGAGEILRQLHDHWPTASFVGYDIAEDALRLAQSRTSERLRFELADAAQASMTYDLMLVMDVIEHVGDPVEFLAKLRERARQIIVHIPLDLCALSVVRRTDLLNKRESLGHIHYFTRETALATVEDAGYRIVNAVPTRTFELWGPSWKGRLLRRYLSEDVAMRWLGGYSLLVRAAPDPGQL